MFHIECGSGRKEGSFTVIATRVIAEVVLSRISHSALARFSTKAEFFAPLYREAALYNRPFLVTLLNPLTNSLYIQPTIAP